MHRISFLHPNAIARNAFNLRKVPFLIAQRAHTPRLQPPLDTIQMEYMSAISKCNAKSIVIGRAGIGLIFNGGFVDGIATDGTMLGAGIPAPHCN